MTRLGSIQEAAAARVVARQRAKALRIPTIVIDAAGSMAERPLEGGALGAWLESAYIRRLVRDQAANWAEEAEPTPRELFEGLWAVPAPEMHRRRRAGYLVAFVMTPAALASEQFQAACQSASLDAAATRTALTDWAVSTSISVDRTWTVLRWIVEDQSAIASADDAMKGFSRQLADSFEEVSLLYKLGQSMNALVQPERFVGLLCEELHATLPFRWVAAVFVGDRAVARTMAGRLFQTGELEGDPSERSRLAQECLIQAARDPASVVRFCAGQARRADDHPNSLAQPVVRDGRLVGVIIAAEKSGADSQVSSMDTKLVGAGAAYLSILLENSALYDDQQSMFLGTLKALTASIDAKDRYTCGHSERVAHLTRLLGEAAGLPPDTLERFHIAGLVHDVGKIGVPEEVLRKPGKLTDLEFAQIKRHPEIGFNILKDIPQLSDVLPGVLHHHERWDGRGYPHGIRGEDIPRVARVIALADSFDAMSSTRTYRAAMARDKVLAEVEKCAGAQFDPGLAPLFVRLDFSVYDEMVVRHRASEAPETGVAGEAAPRRLEEAA